MTPDPVAELVHLRIRPAEFKDGLELVEISEPIDLVADLKRRDGKREKTTRPASRMRHATRFYKAPWMQQLRPDLSRQVACMYTTVSSTNDRVGATEADCELLISGRIRSY